VGLYTELFYAIIPTLILSMLSADLLSLHLVTFLMFFILVEIVVGATIQSVDSGGVTSQKHFRKRF